MQPVIQQPKLLHLPYLVSKLSSSVFNIWIVTHIRPHFTLLIIMTDQISTGLHSVGIKLNTTQPRIVYNDTNMRIMIELSIEEGCSQVLYIPCLVLLSAGKYRFNQIQPLTPLIYKLDACKRLSIKQRVIRRYM